MVATMKRLAALSIPLTLAALPAAVATDPQELLAVAKAASGGSAWDGVTHLHLQGTLSTSGLEGTFESWEELFGGRSVTRADLGVVKVANGFDGTTPWNQDTSGDVTEQGSEEGLREARNQAYLTARGFWYPERWGAEVASGGTREVDGHAYHVLELVPEGGRTLELWLDAGSGLPARTVEVDARPVATTFLSDYRSVGGLRLPHHLRTSNSDTKYDTVVEVTSVEVNPKLEGGFFAVPKVAVDDFVIAGGASSTALPFELLNNHIYVEGVVNGDRRGRFLVDTGGVNLLTDTAAARFGIEPEGAIQGRGAGEGTVDVGVAKLESFTFGAVTLRRPTFFVLPLGEVMAVEGVDFDGLIGFEVFKRFVVEIDYAGRRLTLTRPEAFEYRGKGQTVPFRFDDRTPVVEGSVASLPGTFSIDTGSRSTLDLFGPFVAAHDLDTRLGSRFEALTGWGVGGGVRSKVAPGTAIRIGGVEVPDVVVTLSLQREGPFADQYLAGNIGGGVLKRFTVTFDYRNKVMILEPNRQFGTPEPYDRAGMWVNRAGDAFEVVDVVHGGAAAKAGIRVGERIVACDGKPATELPLTLLRERFRREPPGTAFELAVVSRSGEERTSRLVLEDLLAEQPEGR